MECCNLLGNPGLSKWTTVGQPRSQAIAHPSFICTLRLDVKICINGLDYNQTFIYNLLNKPIVNKMTQEDNKSEDGGAGIGSV